MLTHILSNSLGENGLRGWPSTSGERHHSLFGHEDAYVYNS